MFSINRLSETDVKQPEHEEIDNEEDLLRIDPGDNDISESGKILFLILQSTLTLH